MTSIEASGSGYSRDMPESDRITPEAEREPQAGQFGEADHEHSAEVDGSDR